MHIVGPTRSFLFVLGSARRGGNTETLARQAAASLPGEVGQRWLHLDDLPLPHFDDHRHQGDGTYAAPEGHERTLLEATLAASDIVIVSPLYWYNVSATTKLYLDFWTGWMRVPGLDFKARMGGKTLWAVTTFSDGDPAMVEPMEGTLRWTAHYLSMCWGGGLVGDANRPGDVLQDSAALRRADGFFAGSTCHGAR
jgi:multimeric flavodoxin WrbA